MEVWIAHMGGPFWARKDARAWSIPKGEYLDDEDPLAAAQREFAEEMGTPAPSADYLPLGAFRQPSGKVITVFAAESDFAPEQIVSNTFALEWPKGSGTVRNYPEVDGAKWSRSAGGPHQAGQRANCRSSTRSCTIWGRRDLTGAGPDRLLSEPRRPLLARRRTAILG